MTIFPEIDVNQAEVRFDKIEKEHEALDLSSILRLTSQKFPQNRLEFLVRFVSRQNEHLLNN